MEPSEITIHAIRWLKGCIYKHLVLLAALERTKLLMSPVLLVLLATILAVAGMAVILVGQVVFQERDGVAAAIAVQALFLVLDGGDAILAALELTLE